MNSNPRTIINTIKSVRVSTNRSMKACADLLRISLDRYAAYETGTLLPSLPEIELLAHFLNIPLSALLEGEYEPIPSNNLEPQDNFEAFMNLRHKIIGAKIRLIRNEKNLSGAELSSKAGFCESDLEAYELGLIPIRISILNRILAILESSYFDLIDCQNIKFKRQEEGEDSKFFSLFLKNGNSDIFDNLTQEELHQIHKYITDLINNQALLSNNKSE